MVRDFSLLTEQIHLVKFIVIDESTTVDRHFKSTAFASRLGFDTSYVIISNINVTFTKF